jgi:hypothetical protein
MTRKKAMRITHLENALVSLGFTSDEVAKLRRISNGLRRWYELECGIDSGGVERDEKTGKCFWYSSHTGRHTPYADRETGMLKRLATLMEARTPLSYYLQTDPRGASLYILRPGDVPAGENVDSYYSRGIAIH